MDHDEDRSLSLGTEISVSVPPPSPLTGCYLLAVIGEPHTEEHKEIIIQRLVKGLQSWDSNEHQVDLEKELMTLTAQAPEGEDARNGERLIQFASENLVTEILIHPQMNTLMQCMRNLLSSFTRHRHLIHAGYTFAGNGSWIVQDGTFSLADFTDAYQENEVQRVIRAYENSISIDIHCSTMGGGEWANLPEMPFVKYCKLRVNPTDILDSGSQAIKDFVGYLNPYIIPASLEQLLVSSDVVGNIRFSHPTLYVFPGGQGDAALFGINGFNMLVDGGFSRKACWWDFARHLDRLDAVMLTRVNNCSVAGMAAVLKRKAGANVYPHIGHFFCNLEERRVLASPDGDKDSDPLLVSLLQEGSDMMADVRHINLKPQHCWRSPDPINLYHKVGHGTLDMYVLNPSKDSKHVRDFLKKWHGSEQKLFKGPSVSGPFNFPIPNIVSICALLVWRPANPDENVTRLMFPGSTPQHKIFEGLEKLKHLEFLQHPKCTGRQITTTPSPVPTTVHTTVKRSTTKTTKDKQSTTEKKDEKTEKESVIKTGKDRITSEKKSEKIYDANHTEKLKDETDSKNYIDNKLINELIDGEDKKIESVLREAITSRVETKLDGTSIESITKKQEFKKKDKLMTEKKIKRIDKIEDNKEATLKSEAKKSENENKLKMDIRKKIDNKFPSTTTRAKLTQKSSQKVSEKKMVTSTGDKKPTMDKSPPSTPKKTLETKATKEPTPPASARLKTKIRKQSPGSTPAKSTKEANNRRVVESKYKQASPKRELTARTTEKKEIKAKREPISRRPRPLGSPVKAIKLMKSPTKAAKSIKIDPKLKGLQRVNYEDILKDAKKSDEENSKSIDDFKQDIDDKEEQEIVREIEAVFNRDSEADEKIEYIGRSDIEKITCLIGESKTEVSADGEFEEEYLIIEKEEIDHYTEESALSHEPQEQEDELQKHAKDKKESEKKKEVTEITPQIIDVEEEMAVDTKQTESKDHSLSVEEKQDLSSEKKTSDSKNGQAKIKNVLPETQQDEKVSSQITVESGATTTAPTLPEDERITLDDIKEDNHVEEKYVNEETKEILPPQTLADIPMERKVNSSQIRDIVKTPDEVADLPLHEEVDYQTYEEKKTPFDENKLLLEDNLETPIPIKDDDVFKRLPDVGFVHEIKVPKNLPLPDPTENMTALTDTEPIQDDVIVSTLQKPSHAELVTVTPGSAPESPMYPENKDIKDMLVGKSLDTVKEFEGTEYCFGFTEKLRETHITTVESPLKETANIVEEILCLPDKIPSIPEDVEKEMEEAKLLDGEKSPKSPKEVEQIVASVAEVLKSEKPLEELIPYKPTLVSHDDILISRPETTEDTEQGKIEVTESQNVLLADLQTNLEVKDYSPARSTTPDEGSDGTDKTVLSEAKKLLEIKPEIDNIEISNTIENDDSVFKNLSKEEDFRPLQLNAGQITSTSILGADVPIISERKLSSTLESAKTLEKLEERMTELRKKDGEKHDAENETFIEVSDTITKIDLGGKEGSQILPYKVKKKDSTDLATSIAIEDVPAPVIEDDDKTDLVEHKDSKPDLEKINKGNIVQESVKVHSPEVKLELDYKTEKSIVDIHDAKKVKIEDSPKAIEDTKLESQTEDKDVVDHAVIEMNLDQLTPEQVSGQMTEIYLTDEKQQTANIRSSGSVSPATEEDNRETSLENKPLNMLDSQISKKTPRSSDDIKTTENSKVDFKEIPVILEESKESHDLTTSFKKSSSALLLTEIPTTNAEKHTNLETSVIIDSLQHVTEVKVTSEKDLSQPISPAITEEILGETANTHQSPESNKVSSPSGREVIIKEESEIAKNDLQLGLAISSDLAITKHHDESASSLATPKVETTLIKENLQDTTEVKTTPDDVTKDSTWSVSPAKKEESLEISPPEEHINAELFQKSSRAGSPTTEETIAKEEKGMMIQEEGTLGIKNEDAQGILTGLKKVSTLTSLTNDVLTIAHTDDTTCIKEESDVTISREVSPKIETVARKDSLQVTTEVGVIRDTGSKESIEKVFYGKPSSTEYSQETIAKEVDATAPIEKNMDIEEHDVTPAVAEETKKSASRSSIQQLQEASDETLDDEAVLSGEPALTESSPINTDNKDDSDTKTNIVKSHSKEPNESLQVTNDIKAPCDIIIKNSSLPASPAVKEEIMENSAQDKPMEANQSQISSRPGSPKTVATITKEISEIIREESGASADDGEVTIDDLIISKTSPHREPTSRKASMQAINDIDITLVQEPKDSSQTANQIIKEDLVKPLYEKLITSEQSPKSSKAGSPTPKEYIVDDVNEISAKIINLKDDLSEEAINTFSPTKEDWPTSHIAEATIAPKKSDKIGDSELSLKMETSTRKDSFEDAPDAEASRDSASKNSSSSVSPHIVEQNIESPIIDKPISKEGSRQSSRTGSPITKEFMCEDDIINRKENEHNEIQEMDTIEAECSKLASSAQESLLSVAATESSVKSEYQDKAPNTDSTNALCESSQTITIASKDILQATTDIEKSKAQELLKTSRSISPIVQKEATNKSCQEEHESQEQSQISRQDESPDTKDSVDKDVIELSAQKEGLTPDIKDKLDSQLVESETNEVFDDKISPEIELPARENILLNATTVKTAHDDVSKDLSRSLSPIISAESDMKPLQRKTSDEDKSHKESRSGSSTTNEFITNEVSVPSITKQDIQKTPTIETNLEEISKTAASVGSTVEDKPSLNLTELSIKTTLYDKVPITEFTTSKTSPEIAMTTDAKISKKSDSILSISSDIQNDIVKETSHNEPATPDQSHKSIIAERFVIDETVTQEVTESSAKEDNYKPSPVDVSDSHILSESIMVKEHCDKIASTTAITQVGDDSALPIDSTQSTIPIIVSSLLAESVLIKEHHIETIQLNEDSTERKVSSQDTPESKDSSQLVSPAIKEESVEKISEDKPAGMDQPQKSSETGGLTTEISNVNETIASLKVDINAAPAEHVQLKTDSPTINIKGIVTSRKNSIEVVNDINKTLTQESKDYFQTASPAIIKEILDKQGETESLEYSQKLSEAHSPHQESEAIEGVCEENKECLTKDNSTLVTESKELTQNCGLVKDRSPVFHITESIVIKEHYDEIDRNEIDLKIENTTKIDSMQVAFDHQASHDSTRKVSPVFNEDNIDNTSLNKPVSNEESQQSSKTSIPIAEEFTCKVVSDTSTPKEKDQVTPTIETVPRESNESASPVKESFRSVEATESLIKTEFQDEALKPDASDSITKANREIIRKDSLQVSSNIDISLAQVSKDSVSPTIQKEPNKESFQDQPANQKQSQESSRAESPSTKETVVQEVTGITAREESIKPDTGNMSDSQLVESITESSSRKDSLQFDKAYDKTYIKATNDDESKDSSQSLSTVILKEIKDVSVQEAPAEKEKSPKISPTIKGSITDEISHVFIQKEILQDEIEGTLTIETDPIEISKSDSPAMDISTNALGILNSTEESSLSKTPMISPISESVEIKEHHVETASATIVEQPAEVLCISKWESAPGKDVETTYDSKSEDSSQLVRSAIIEESIGISLQDKPKSEEQSQKESRTSSPTTKELMATDDTVSIIPKEILRYDTQDSFIIETCSNVIKSGSPVKEISLVCKDNIQVTADIVSTSAPESQDSGGSLSSVVQKETTEEFIHDKCVTPDQSLKSSRATSPSSKETDISEVIADTDQKDSLTYDHKDETTIVTGDKESGNFGILTEEISGISQISYHDDELTTIKDSLNYSIDIEATLESSSKESDLSDSPAIIEVQSKEISLQDKPTSKEEAPKESRTCSPTTTDITVDGDSTSTTVKEILNDNNRDSAIIEACPKEFIKSGSPSKESSYLTELTTSDLRSDKEVSVSEASLQLSTDTDTTCAQGPNDSDQLISQNIQNETTEESLHDKSVPSEQSVKPSESASPSSKETVIAEVIKVTDDKESFKCDQTDETTIVTESNESEKSARPTKEDSDIPQSLHHYYGTANNEVCSKIELTTGKDSKKDDSIDIEATLVSSSKESELSDSPATIEESKEISLLAKPTSKEEAPKESITCSPTTTDIKVDGDSTSTTLKEILNDNNRDSAIIKACPKEFIKSVSPSKESAYLTELTTSDLRSDEEVSVPEASLQVSTDTDTTCALGPNDSDQLICQNIQNETTEESLHDKSVPSEQSVKPSESASPSSKETVIAEVIKVTDDKESLKCDQTDETTIVTESNESEKSARPTKEDSVIPQSLHHDYGTANNEVCSKIELTTGKDSKKDDSIDIEATLESSSKESELSDSPATIEESKEISLLAKPTSKEEAPKESITCSPTTTDIKVDGDSTSTTLKEILNDNNRDSAIIKACPKEFIKSVSPSKESAYLTELTTSDLRSDEEVSVPEASLQVSTDTDTTCALGPNDSDQLICQNIQNETTEESLHDKSVPSEQSVKPSESASPSSKETVIAEVIKVTDDKESFKCDQYDETESNESENFVRPTKEDSEIPQIIHHDYDTASIEVCSKIEQPTRKDSMTEDSTNIEAIHESSSKESNLSGSTAIIEESKEISLQAKSTSTEEAPKERRTSIPTTADIMAHGDSNSTIDEKKLHDNTGDLPIIEVCPKESSKPSSPVKEILFPTVQLTSNLSGTTCAPGSKDSARLIYQNIQKETLEETLQDKCVTDIAEVIGGSDQKASLKRDQKDDTTVVTGSKESGRISSPTEEGSIIPKISHHDQTVSCEIGSKTELSISKDSINDNERTGECSLKESSLSVSPAIIEESKEKKIQGEPTNQKQSPEECRTSCPSTTELIANKESNSTITEEILHDDTQNLPIIEICPKETIQSGSAVKETLFSTELPSSNLSSDKEANLQELTDPYTACAQESKDNVRPISQYIQKDIKEESSHEKYATSEPSQKSSDADRSTSKEAVIQEANEVTTKKEHLNAELKDDVSIVSEFKEAAKSASPIKEGLPIPQKDEAVTTSAHLVDAASSDIKPKIESTTTLNSMKIPTNIEATYDRRSKDSSRSVSPAIAETDIIDTKKHELILPTDLKISQAGPEITTARKESLQTSTDFTTHAQETICTSSSVSPTAKKVTIDESRQAQTITSEQSQKLSKAGSIIIKETGVAEVSKMTVREESFNSEPSNESAIEKISSKPDSPTKEHSSFAESTTINQHQDIPASCEISLKMEGTQRKDSLKVGSEVEIIRDGDSKDSSRSVSPAVPEEKKGKPHQDNPISIEQSPKTSKIDSPTVTKLKIEEIIDTSASKETLQVVTKDASIVETRSDESVKFAKQVHENLLAETSIKPEFNDENISFHKSSTTKISPNEVTSLRKDISQIAMSIDTTGAPESKDSSQSVSPALENETIEESSKYEERSPRSSRSGSPVGKESVIIDRNEVTASKECLNADIKDNKAFISELSNNSSKQSGKGSPILDNLESTTITEYHYDSATSEVNIKLEATERKESLQFTTNIQGTLDGGLKESSRSVSTSIEQSQESSRANSLTSIEFIAKEQGQLLVGVQETSAIHDIPEKVSKLPSPAEKSNLQITDPSILKHHDEVPTNESTMNKSIIETISDVSEALTSPSKALEGSIVSQLPTSAIEHDLKNISENITILPSSVLIETLNTSFDQGLASPPLADDNDVTKSAINVSSRSAMTPAFVDDRQKLSKTDNSKIQNNYIESNLTSQNSEDDDQTCFNISISERIVEEVIDENVYDSEEQVYIAKPMQRIEESAHLQKTESQTNLVQSNEIVKPVSTTITTEVKPSNGHVPVEFNTAHVCKEDTNENLPEKEKQTASGEVTVENATYSVEIPETVKETSEQSSVNMDDHMSISSSIAFADSKSDYIQEDFATIINQRDIQTLNQPIDTSVELSETKTANGHIKQQENEQEESMSYISMKTDLDSYDSMTLQDQDLAKALKDEQLDMQEITSELSHKTFSEETDLMQKSFVSIFESTLKEDMESMNTLASSSEDISKEISCEEKHSFECLEKESKKRSQIQNVSTSSSIKTEIDSSHRECISTKTAYTETGSPKDVSLSMTTDSGIMSLQANKELGPFEGEDYTQTLKDNAVNLMESVSKAFGEDSVQQGIKTESVDSFVVRSEFERVSTPPTVPVSPLPKTPSCIQDLKVTDGLQSELTYDKTEGAEETITKVIHVGDDILTQKISTSTEKAVKPVKVTAETDESNLSSLMHSMGKIRTETDTVTKIIKEGVNVVTQTITTVTTKEIISREDGTPQNVKTTIETTTLSKGSDGSTTTTKDTQTLLSECSSSLKSTSQLDLYSKDIKLEKEYLDTSEDKTESLSSQISEKESSLRSDSSSTQMKSEQALPLRSEFITTIDDDSDDNIEDTVIDTDVSKKIIKEGGLDIVQTVITTTKKEVLKLDDTTKILRITTETNITKERPDGSKDTQKNVDVRTEEIHCEKLPKEDAGQGITLDDIIGHRKSSTHQENLVFDTNQLTNIQKSDNKLGTEISSSSIRDTTFGVEDNSVPNDIPIEQVLAEFTKLEDQTVHVDTQEKTVSRQGVLVKQKIIITTIKEILTSEDGSKKKLKTTIETVTETKLPNGTTEVVKDIKIAIADYGLEIAGEELQGYDCVGIPDEQTSSNTEEIFENNVKITRKTTVTTIRQEFENITNRVRKIKTIVRTIIEDEHPNGTIFTKKSEKTSIADVFLNTPRTESGEQQICDAYTDNSEIVEDVNEDTDVKSETIQKENQTIIRTVTTKTKRETLNSSNATVKRVRTTIETITVDEYPNGATETTKDVKITVSEIQTTSDSELQSALAGLQSTGRIKSTVDKKHNVTMLDGEEVNQTITTNITKEEFKCTDTDEVAIKTVTETITENTKKNGSVEISTDLKTQITYLPYGSTLEDLTEEHLDVIEKQPVLDQTPHKLPLKQKIVLPISKQRSPMGEPTSDTEVFTKHINENGVDVEQTITVVTTKELVSPDKIKTTIETTTVNKGSDGVTKTLKATKTSFSDLEDKYGTGESEKSFSKTDDLRSSSAASDDLAHGFGSPPSDLSSRESKATHAWGTESSGLYYSDEDGPGSPSSTKSQIPHSPRSNLSFELEPSKTHGMETSFYKDPMTSSVYAQLPEELHQDVKTEKTITKLTHEFLTHEKLRAEENIQDIKVSDASFLKEADEHFDKAIEEHKKVSGSKVISNITAKYDLDLVQSTSHQETTADESQIILQDIISDSKKVTEIATSSTSKQETKTKKSESSEITTIPTTKDPIESWGKPLGLPSPIMPPTQSDGKSTPKKQNPMLNKNKINQEKIKEARKSSQSPSKRKPPAPVYLDLTYVPHHGNSYYSAVEFFKRVRARYYVFSGTEPSKEIYNALLDAKKTWEDKELEVTIIPTYDTDVLGYWVTENEDALEKYKIDLSPSASRCTINLQDHETSCAAYRLEF